MAVTLGTAPDSWGVWFADDPHQPAWSQFLDEVAGLGYRWIELGPLGYMPANPASLRGELESRGLRLAAGGVMFPLESAAALERTLPELEQVCKLLHEFEAQYLILIDAGYGDLITGKAIAPATLDAPGWQQLIATVERVAAIASLHGLSTLLHPHAETHVESEAQIERFLFDVSEEIGLCFDVGHHSYAGGDPVSFFERFHARIPYLHLKSVNETLISTVRSEGWPFSQAVAEGVFVEPERGAIDFEVLSAALERTGYDGFAIVEQDMYPTTPDKPLPIARRTLNYLQTIGFGAPSTSVSSGVAATMRRSVSTLEIEEPSA